jgi:hypothetical protein
LTKEVCIKTKKTQQKEGNGRKQRTVYKKASIKKKNSSKKEKNECVQKSMDKKSKHQTKDASINRQQNEIKAVKKESSIKK